MDAFNVEKKKRTNVHVCINNLHVNVHTHYKIVIILLSR